MDSTKPSTSFGSPLKHSVLAVGGKNPARDRQPGSLWGSRVIGLMAHRHIDIDIFNRILPASLATWEELSAEQQYD